MKKKHYYIIDLLFFIACAITLVMCLKKIYNENVIDVTFMQIITILITYMLTSGIKCLRLYIIIFEKKYSMREYVYFFLKTAAINAILPFKSGEIYRGYLLGTIYNSYMQGYIMVLLDRFVDTLALLTIVFGLCIFGVTGVESIYVILLLFVIFIMVIYISFESLYQYWNQYLIFYRTSKRTLEALNLLDILKKFFDSIRKGFRGRLLFIYLLSLIAWGIEMVGMLMFQKEKTSLDIYLSDILFDGSRNVNYFIFMLSGILIAFIGKVVVSLTKAERGK